MNFLCKRSSDLCVSFNNIVFFFCHECYTPWASMTYTHVRAIESSTKSSAAIVVHEKEECKYCMFHLPLFYLHPIPTFQNVAKQEEDGGWNVILQEGLFTSSPLYKINVSLPLTSDIFKDAYGWIVINELLCLVVNITIIWMIHKHRAKYMFHLLKQKRDGNKSSNTNMETTSKYRIKIKIYFVGYIWSVRNGVG